MTYFYKKKSISFIKNAFALPDLQNKKKKIKFFSYNSTPICSTLRTKLKFSPYSHFSPSS